MGSQNYISMGIGRLGHIMLDDRRRKTSDIYKAALKRQKSEDYNPPLRVDDAVELRSVFEKRGLCFYVMPKGREAAGYFMYVHGGGFISQITHNEWRFVTETVAKTGYGAVVPIYPLAPEHSVTEALEMLIAAYDKLCEDENVDRLVILGSSSGGCLALSMAIHLWKKGSRRPDKLVLASPVLDTEFPDRGLEKSLKDKRRFSYHYYYSSEIKKFLKKYWVREAEGRYDITSPIHYDITDVCDEMAIFTTSDDLLSCYARGLYEKANSANMKVRYYEFPAVVHDYMEHPIMPECRVIIRKLEESVRGEADYVPADIENDIWCRAMLAERYPRLYVDPEAIRLSEAIGIEHRKMNAGYSFYDRTVIMERLLAVDARVRNFIDRYADGIIVNVGCELDTMFSRVDNGRIRWYNVDFPERIEVRRSYMSVMDRETNVECQIFDYKWLQQISKPQGAAILFVAYDTMRYFDRDRLRDFLDAVWRRFPGAEVVFDAKNSVGRRRWNMSVLRGRNRGELQKLSIDNCTSLLYDWNIKYRLLYDGSVLNRDDLEKMYTQKDAARFRHAIAAKYDKVIHLRLGSEHFLEND